MQVAYGWPHHQLSRFPSIVPDTRKNSAPASRNLLLATKLTKNAPVAHRTTIKPILRITGQEQTEYSPESHSNAQYQSKNTPPIAKHKTSYHGCRALPKHALCAERQTKAAVVPRHLRSIAPAGRSSLKVLQKPRPDRDQQSGAADGSSGLEPSAGILAHLPAAS